MMEKIKENGVFIGVITFVIFIIGFIFISSTASAPERKGEKGGEERGESVVENQMVESGTFVGTVANIDGKGGALSYSFMLPLNATSTVEEAGAYIVTSIGTSPFTKIYISDERVRAQSPLLYLKTLIAPHVVGFSMGNEEKIGLYSWQVAESATMEWHVTSILSGKWVVMVESYKRDKDLVQKTLESIKVGDELENNVR